MNRWSTWNGKKAGTLFLACLSCLWPSVKHQKPKIISKANCISSSLSSYLDYFVYIASLWRHREYQAETQQEMKDKVTKERCARGWRSWLDLWLPTRGSQVQTPEWSRDELWATFFRHIVCGQGCYTLSHWSSLSTFYRGT